MQQSVRRFFVLVSWVVLFMFSAAALAVEPMPPGMSANSAKIDLKMALGGDAATRSVVVAYGRAAQLRYASTRPGIKDWRLELLANPDDTLGVPDAIRVKLKLAEPEGAGWKVVQEAEMVLLPGQPGSLTGGQGSAIRDMEVIVTQLFIALPKEAPGLACPDILLPGDGLAGTAAARCCGGRCGNGDNWSCCGGVSCCVCGSCCSNAAGIPGHQ